MKLTYRGADITASVKITLARTTDREGGKADTLYLVLEDAQDWYDWGPTEDDTITLEEDGYTTGLMFVDSISPDGEGFALTACSLPMRAREQAWGSYQNVTLGNMLAQAGAEAGVEYALYGINGAESYRRLVRRNESLPAMLDRLLIYEGGRLKCAGGKLCAIGVKWAQRQTPICTLKASVRDAGIRHYRCARMAVKMVKVISPNWQGLAVNPVSVAGRTIVQGDLPVFSNAQAGRWASGIALHEMRRTEEILWEIDYDGRMAAFSRVDITGVSAMEGEWICRKVEHDFIERRTTLYLARCVDAI